MSLLPDRRLGKIEFYESRVVPWAERAEQIGLAPDEVALLAERTAQARAAYDAALAAREACKAATLAFHQAVRAMHDAPGLGSDLIQRVRNFAESSDNRAVYSLALIPPPSARSTLPPPGTPYRFRTSLLGSGAVELKWNCANPDGSEGTTYEVLRRVGGAGRGGGDDTPFVFVGARGVKSFIDDTLPSGAASITYQVTAVRSKTRGNPGRFTMLLGVVPPSLVTAPPSNVHAREAPTGARSPQRSASDGSGAVRAAG